MASHKLYTVIETALVEALHRYGLQEAQGRIHAANVRTNRHVYPGASSSNYLVNFFLLLLNPNFDPFKVDTPPNGPQDRYRMPGPLFPDEYRPNLYEVLRAVFHLSGYAGFYNQELDCYCVPELVAGLPPCHCSDCVCCKRPFPINAALNAEVSAPQTTFNADLTP